MVRAIHVIDDPPLQDTPDFYARTTWPGRTTAALRRLDGEIGLTCCFPVPGKTSEESFTVDGVDFRVFPARRDRYGVPWSPRMLAYLRRVAREKAILHLHGYPSRLFRAVARLPAPLVAQDHGRDPRNYHAKNPLQVPVQRLRQWIDERPLRKVSQFYCIAPGEAQRLASHVDPARVRVQTMGIDEARFRPGDRTAARAALGLPPQDRLMLLVGNDMPRKGADIAVAALAHLPSDVHLALLGRCEPGYRRRLEGEAGKLDVQGRVRFLGVLEDALVAEAYRAANVLLLPTRWEGTHVTVSVMEALATDTPVVTSPAGATREALDGFGLVVDTLEPEAFARTVQEVLGWPPKSSHGYAARRFGWDSIARATLQDYRRLWAAWYAP